MRSKNSPGGRTETFIEAARRAQVVQAAIEAINEVGYGRASLARIAQQAGISKSVISYHFAGKDDLFEQVVTHVLDDCAAFMRPQLDQATTAAEWVRAHIRAELAYMETHHANFVALGEIIVNHRDDDGARRFDDDVDEATVREFVEVLERGQRAGEFRDFDPRVLAVTITQAIDGAMAQWATGAVTDLGAYAEELVTVVDLATRKEPT